MTTRPVPVAPDWLVPGAKVVMHSSYGYTQRASRAEIAKVAAHSFTVTGSPIRFRIDDQKHYDDTTRWLTQVVPEDSPEGQKLLAASRRRMKTKRLTGQSVAPPSASPAFADEREILFGNMTTDLGELKERIQEIIDGKYRDDAD